ncbi:beta-ketoacyl-ACP synthase I [Candidatus Purcelliella pentastirinorum]|uniref:3-oxoacyl-[acyl-carrier-protein] synthase 1 n=1 Tax=Candidatus Purcelliella pentastirinorum TaxID=472834 RepID=A0AAX3N7J7_9ENTR|nr:beta-ketoacyl-ACP synthase I [Candidatus Purcelliella pentastirinorum]WDI78476.1 beta-ketoacyl-ACP synthase I [Candidatus Purcelliella pentastirinorum]
MKRAVITGIGIVSSIGNNKSDVLYSLINGCSGIIYSQKMKDVGLRSNVWGNIDLDIKGLIDRKILRFMSDASIYAYLSMKQAVSDSCLSANVYQNNPRVGIIVGSGGGSPKSQVYSADAVRSPRGIKSLGPYMVTRAMASGVSACLATPFKIYGLNFSISSACATSAHCIGSAYEQIQYGKQDIIFAGGAEELSWELACEFDAMGALSTKYNHDPSIASRTYDKKRDGFVISGGAGIVVIEELQHALNRDAHIYAEIIGYGATSDGYDMVVPSGDGAVRCMKIAMKDLDMGIDYINTHGTSTIIGDTKELYSICTVFDKNIPPISSTKSMTGHSLGASGVHEIIYSVLMLENNFIAPSINIQDLEDLAKDIDVVLETRRVFLNTIMSNSFGFGGTNAVLIVKKYH